MAEKLSVLAPRDPWPFSMTDEDLQGLVDGGMFCPRSLGAHPEWLALGDEQELTPHVGYVVIFIPFHEWGFGVPTSQ
jgi:hypothetical protein